MSDESNGVSDFELEDVPTGKISIPDLRDVPLVVYGHGHALRRQAKRLTRLESIGWRIIAAIASGTITIVLAIVGSAFWVGERTAAIGAVAEQARRNDERITHLEHKFMDERHGEGAHVHD